jgi:tRNA (mo5U34)-methyltransferase
VIQSVKARKERRSLLQRVASVPFWWHSIDLGHGVVTPGAKSAEHLEAELESFRFPDLDAKSFLDIGAWDGFYSFEAERRGARPVVAQDHYVWSWSPRPDLRPQDLPDKKRGFEVAHEALSSNVRVQVGDFMTMDLAALGEYDVVLFAGVLYHLQSPLDALRRLALVTAELAIIETAAVAVGGFEDNALCEFYESDELGGDPTNWWAPTAAALRGLCRAAGFRDVTTFDPAERSTSRGQLERYRLVAHARK